MSRQKVDYHLNKLRAHGLVQDAGTRRWGGLIERLLVATAVGLGRVARRDGGGGQ